MEELQPGLSAKIERKVSKTSTAKTLGSGELEVLATPEVIRMMEAASVAALKGHLPEGYTSVGVSMEVQHHAPTPIGLNLTVRAALTEVRGKRLTFHVSAYDDVDNVAKGTHERVIVEVAGFMERAQYKLKVLGGESPGDSPGGSPGEGAAKGGRKQSGLLSRSGG